MAGPIAIHYGFKTENISRPNYPPTAQFCVHNPNTKPLLSKTFVSVWELRKGKEKKGKNGGESEMLGLGGSWSSSGLCFYSLTC
jgi:hypothetical protein